MRSKAERADRRGHRDEGQRSFLEGIGSTDPVADQGAEEDRSLFYTRGGHGWLNKEAEEQKPENTILIYSLIIKERRNALPQRKTDMDRPL